MSFRIKLDPEAKKDIQAAIDWYDLQRKGLGREFFASLSQSIKTLETNPLLVAIRYSDIRMKKIHRFPYCIHFLVNEDKRHVVILAVVHTSRDPDRNWVWKK